MGHAMSLYAEGRYDELRELVHPEAEIQMLYLGGDVARGPDGLVAALRQAASSIHSPVGTGIEGIDDRAAILLGRILHEVPSGGLSDHSAAWLGVLSDGLMWRVLVYRDAAEARRAYETHFHDASSPP